ncbi:hypothetical protein, partial [Pseudomonas putida]|uniref:hypothetical protein n=1 Tax=Pseudomonas putida TaxID=303 RepID=UPI001ED915C8
QPAPPVRPGRQEGKRSANGPAAWAVKVPGKKEWLETVEERRALFQGDDSKDKSLNRVGNFPKVAVGGD